MKLATTIIGKTTDDISTRAARSPASCSRPVKSTSSSSGGRQRGALCGAKTLCGRRGNSAGQAVMRCGREHQSAAIEKDDRFR